MPKIGCKWSYEVSSTSEHIQWDCSCTEVMEIAAHKVSGLGVACEADRLDLT
jgi:hypothetical protein